MADVEDLLRTASAPAPPAMVDSAGDPLSPTLDGNSGDDSDKEDSADDPAEGNQRFVGSSLLTEDALRRMWKKCGFSQEIEAQVLLEKERPWSAPPGWVCLYSLYFLQSRLWFPLPRLLTSYAVKRDVAISQMSPADIRNMVIALVLGAEVDVDVDVEFFKMISQMNFITDETFSVSIKARCRLMDGRGPSKVDGWQRKYFFIHISPASVLNSSAVFRTEWNPQPVAHGKHWPLPSWGNNRLQRVLGSGRISWGDFSVERFPGELVLVLPQLLGLRRGRETLRPVGGWERLRGIFLCTPAAVIKGPASGLSLVNPKGGTSSFPSIPTPIVTISAAPFVDPSTSVVHPSPDKAMGDRELVPVVDSSHLGVPASSLLAASSCPDVLVDCAQFLRSFRLSSSSMPALENFVFSWEYVEWASYEAQSKIRGNHLLGLYERKYKRLFDDLKLERRLLVEEKDKSSSISLSLKASEEGSSKFEAENRDLRVEVECLKGDAAERDRHEKGLLSQKSALEVEVARLNESRTELIESERRRVESVMSARFGDFVKKVRKYLSDRDVVLPQVLDETQLLDVISCLKLFIEEGIPIPAEKLAENEQALLVQSAALDQMDVLDLELTDLPSFSLDEDLTVD
ncbi:meiosis-specific protein ASY2-like [Brassica napus]|uniref:meiosis-specific protein ASY2-like n=1 Tax=Brassica napus TaxID=3708 RepID=UPI002078E78B|nr:meiosis-specific protein ASY2-like [Brassica napus]